MNPLQKNITEIAGQVAERLGFLLIEVSFKGDNRNRVIEIFIDSLKGVTIDECAQMSHEVASVIETTDLITSKYRLDVSSPGIDRSLKFPEQFPKHINRKFELILKDVPEPKAQKTESGEATENFKALDNEAENPVQKSSKQKKFVGKLLKVDGDILTFSVNNSETNINFNNIKTAKVLVSF